MFLAAVFKVILVSDEQVPVADTGKKKKPRVPASIKIPDGSVEPFPYERFLTFVGALMVQTKDYGLVNLKLLGSQLYVLTEIMAGLEDGVTTFVILKARQLGISTLFLALDLFWAFEHQGLLGIFATHDEGSRDQFRNQIDVFLTTLPKGYRIDPETNNRQMLVLKNASVFRYLVAGTRTTTNKLGRSGGCNFLHATEVAFWGSADDIKALGQTLSELYRNRLYVYESTANGFNHYHDMCETAKASPAQKFIFVGWWRDERNEFDESHPLYLKYMPQGARTPLTPLERRRIKEVKQEYGFRITAGQIAWYRFHLETKCGGDMAAMDQEMPWTAEDAFVATGDSFFSNETLTILMRAAKKYLCLPYVFRLTERFEEIELHRSRVERAELKIWERPHPRGKYVLGCDPAYGSSPDADAAVISIFRCYADCCVQVGEFVSTSASTHQCAWVLAFLAGLYKDVTVNLELTGPGTPVYQELGQLRQKTGAIAPDQNPEMRNCLRHIKDFLFSRPDSLSGSVVRQWRTSPETRTAMLHKFKSGIELHRCIVKSLACLEEMRKIVIDEGHIGAPPGRHDDRVFAAGLAFWAWDERVRPQLLAEGRTLENERRTEETGGIDPVQGLVAKFLKDAQINVSQ